VKPVKIKIFLLGCLAIIFFLEIGLWITGVIHLKRTFGERRLNYNQDKGVYTILCLGDSFTYGIGAISEKSYPKQLEYMLWKRFPEKRILVVNGGMPTYNTAQILHDLPSNIKSVNPNLIILLAGDANSWNFWGYHEYLKGKNLFSALYNQLYRVRLYKLIKLLYGDIRNKIKIARLVKGKEYKDDHSYIFERKIEKNSKLIYKNFIPPTFIKNLPCSTRGNVHGSLDQFKNGAAVDVQNSYDHNSMGWICLEQGNREEALEWFKKGIKINDKDARSYGGIGWIYFSEGKQEKAIELFKKGITLDQKDSSCHGGMGWISFYQEKYEEAIEWFKKGVAIDSRNSYNYNGLGESYKVLGKHAEAIEWFKKAIELAPNNSSNYCGILESVIVEEKHIEMTKFLQDTVPNASLAADFIKMLNKKNNISKEILLWTKTDMEKIIQICSNKGIKMILSNYPKGNVRLSNKVKNLAWKYKIPFVDNLRIFSFLRAPGKKEEDYFYIDEHCNDRGYEMIAKNIYDVIIKEKMINEP